MSKVYFLQGWQRVVLFVTEFSPNLFVCVVGVKCVWFFYFGTTRITRKIKTSIENKRSLRLYKYSFLNKNDSSNLIHFHFPWINYRFGWYIKFKRGGGGKIFQRIPRTGHLLYSKVKYVLFSKLIKHFWPFYGFNYG